MALTVSAGRTWRLLRQEDSRNRSLDLASSSLPFPALRNLGAASKLLERDIALAAVVAGAFVKHPDSRPYHCSHVLRSPQDLALLPRQHEVPERQERERTPVVVERT